MKTFYHDTFPTPLGNFSVAVDGTGAVAATAFGDARALEPLLPSGQLVPDERRTGPARRELREYFSGRRRDFNLPLAAEGTEFQQAVWQQLAGIPYGETRSYGDIAKKIRRPKASRAVGRANATNPLCVIVPCHRVIGADGSLTGFAFGEETKRRLLELEGALLPL